MPIISPSRELESWSIEFGTRRVTVEEPLSGKRRLTERAVREENGEKVANAATIWVYRGITKYDKTEIGVFAWEGGVVAGRAASIGQDSRDKIVASIEGTDVLYRGAR